MKEAFTALPTVRKAALVAAAACVVSVFLPWVSVLGISISGFSTDDGKLVLFVAGAALLVLANHAGVLGLFRVGTRVADVVSLVAAAVCLLVAIADMNDFAAIGLYGLLVASIVWVLAAIASFRLRTDETPEPRPDAEAPPG